MKIKIIDYVFDIKCDDLIVSSRFASYLCDEEAKYTISINEADLKFEREQFKDEDISEYQLPLLAVYRKIADSLAEEDVIVFNGSSFICDDLGIMITGKSGVGKSSHTNLYSRYNNIQMIDDDKPLLRYRDGVFTIYSNPYMSKDINDVGINHKLDRLCFIRQSKTNSVSELSPKEKTQMIANQVFLPKDVNSRIKAIDLAIKLSDMKTYVFYGDLSEDAYKLSYDTLCKK